MTITAADLKGRLPALSTVSDEICDANIAAAALRVKVDVWEDLVDEGVLYLAAHLITLDPRGVKARKVDKSGQSVYWSEYERLVSVVASGFRVSGDVSGIIV